ncbi:MAG: penicillin-binding transpeptidase domain-containing protein, partial [Oscillospiraceae bacterium]
MKRKNVVIIFIAFVAGLMALELRLFVLMTDGELAKTARSQSALSVELALHRPDFFDCNGERLTGSDDAAAALAFPRTESGYSLLQYVAADDRVDFLEQMEGNLPFAVRVNPNAASAAPDRVIAIKSRYSADAPCAHIIGTLGPDGHGDSGLEHALDDYLSKASASLCMTVEVNANRQPKSGETPALIQRGATGEGIILTIDKKIQQIVETQAETLIKRGAVVVVDCATSEIRAIASIPDFDPDNVAAYLSQEDSPLFNRALAAYNVGSIYKPVIAAAALSCGIDESFSYECVGRIEVDGQVYTCNDGAAHGTVDMHGAIVKSCNTYFIALGQRAGAAAIFNTASAMGLGKPVSLFG